MHHLKETFRGYYVIGKNYFSNLINTPLLPSTHHLFIDLGLKYWNLINWIFLKMSLKCCPRDDSLLDAIYLLNLPVFWQRATYFEIGWEMKGV